MIIGAGRAKKEDEVDHAVGINIFRKVGEKIGKNEKIAEIYYNDDKNVNESKNMVIDAFVITSEKVEEPKAILEIIE
jgi:pyrimidine-nucleoside phosphorylase